MCDDLGLPSFGIRNNMDKETTSRRTFYGVVINGLMGLITAALAVPALAYLFFKPGSNRKSQWIDAGDLAQLKIGEPQEVTFRRTRVDGWRVLNEKSTTWVVRTGEDKVVAYTPQCTHLACAYHWDAPHKEFVCPCHASTFSVDGKVTGGPAPRPLDRYVTRIDGNKVLVGSTVERSV
jgi:menaquinol-cytochrome c reductase iron-sulfur subunit